ncbi:ester cyclase [uncultured Ruegeria sp.]|uniref:nuclear transport factor 2 family protein n=1 Tax=uncultured Ruegeria sp. TaxID=259304 RepID=UPI002637FDBA|nr:ester cyclase [uncultured Ruegeria sp.]
MTQKNKLPEVSSTASVTPTVRSEAKNAKGGTHIRFSPLKDEHMPTDFSISLEEYRRGGTKEFLGKEPDHLATHSMRGFEGKYKNIVDYIVRITHQIWEEKDIGCIYDTYSHDCRVWDDVGLQYGRDKIVADTVHTNNAFPDVRLVADEVIWAGNDDVSFHTSHRTMIMGTNTGYSRFGPPTNRPLRLFCIANCVARDNEIYDEHVAYDTAALIQQMGFDVGEMARRIASQRPQGPFAPNFAASEPKRLGGQAFPERQPIPDVVDGNVREFVHVAFESIWNRRNFGAMDQVYAPDVVFEGSTSRVYRGVGQLRSHVMSMVAMFPNIRVAVDDIYWMGNAKDGYLVSVRWGGVGAHRGNGPYGEPTGKEAHIWGITQWHIHNNKVQKEWTVFNEFGILMQILSDT